LFCFDFVIEDPLSTFINITVMVSIIGNDSVNIPSLAGHYNLYF